MKVFKAFTYRNHEVSVDVSKTGSHVTIDAPLEYCEMELHVAVSNYSYAAKLAKGLVDAKFRAVSGERRKAA